MGPSVASIYGAVQALFHLETETDTHWTKVSQYMHLQTQCTDTGHDRLVGQPVGIKVEFNTPHDKI